MTNVEKVKAGELAIKNDDRDACIKVVKIIYPNEDAPSGYDKFYRNIRFGDEWMFCESTNLPTIPATELLKEIETPVFSPKRGDLIKVSDNKREWKIRIFLTTIEGAIYPVRTVELKDEKRFIENRPFDTGAFKYMKPLERTKLTKAEIANRLGLDINEFDIIN